MVGGYQSGFRGRSDRMLDGLPSLIYSVRDETEHESLEDLARYGAV